MRNALDTLEYDKLKNIIKNYIQTQYGANALTNLKPVFDIKKAESDFEILNEFFSYFYKWGSFVLEDVFISNIIEDAFVGTLNEKELLKIGIFLNMLKNIENEFNEHESDICQNFIAFDIPYYLFDEIVKAIDEHGFIKDSATSYLFRLRESIKTLKNDITHSLKNFIHSKAKEVIIDTAVFLKRSRYTLLLQSNFKEYVNGRIIDIGKGGGFFVEPDSIYKKNNELEELILKEESEERKILTALTHIVRKNSAKLRYNEKRLGFFDLQIAKFEYSKNQQQPIIKFSDKPVLFAKGVKHPILNHIKDSVISVDINLKNSKELIITGPNTGGKTVFLKTVGLLILSLFSNIPPIASEIEIGRFSGVFAIIGDEQNILESLSSFSAKMIGIKNIYNKIDENSMVLLDEIGSGTSPDEGEAVAYSIISNLTGKCFFITTTHYKKLAYLLYSKGYKTAAFRFDELTLKPTYLLEYGKIGQSYGTDILKTLNMPQEIISTAVEFYKNSETVFNKLEQSMSKKMEQLGEREKVLSDLKKRYETLLANEQEIKEKLILNTKKEEESKKREYEKLIFELQSELSCLLKEKNISKAHKSIAKIKEKADKTFNREKNSSYESFQVGDMVVFNGLKGTITTIKSNKASIDADGKKIVTFLSNLKKAPKVKQEKKKKIEIASSNKFESLEINLIGKRRDEAEIELLRFMDSLSTSFVKTVRIVHGIGSGILKDMVKETLSSHPFVKNFHPARPEEGGDGATVVHLK